MHSARARLALVCLLIGINTTVLVTRTEAQTAVTLNGQITDPQGGAIAQATVVVQAASTSLSWQAVSDDQGRFTVPLLPPGIFDVRVNAANFTPWERRGLRFEVGQDLWLACAPGLGPPAGIDANIESTRTQSFCIGSRWITR